MLFWFMKFKEQLKTHIFYYLEVRMGIDWNLQAQSGSEERAELQMCLMLLAEKLRKSESFFQKNPKFSNVACGALP